jgi:hypothetical protein
MGMGEKFDRAATHPVGAGDMMIIPTSNAADDPRNQ